MRQAERKLAARKEHEERLHAMLHEHHQRKFGTPAPALPLSTSPPVNDSNIGRLSADLVRRARNNTQWFQPTSEIRPTIMLPWGSDWAFSEDAHINFRNMDKIVAYINDHSAERREPHLPQSAHETRSHTLVTRAPT